MVQRAISLSYKGPLNVPDLTLSVILTLPSHISYPLACHANVRVW